VTAPVTTKIELSSEAALTPQPGMKLTSIFRPFLLSWLATSRYCGSFQKWKMESWPSISPLSIVILLGINLQTTISGILNFVAILFP